MRRCAQLLLALALVLMLGVHCGSAPGPSGITPEPDETSIVVECEDDKVWHKPEGMPETEVKKAKPETAHGGDRVSTDRAGKAWLIWPDLEVKLYQQSGVYVLEECGGILADMCLAAMIGTAVIAESRASERLAMVTQGAIVEHAGTTTMVSYHRESQQTIVRVFDGQAEIRSLAGTSSTVVAGKDEWVRVVADGAPVLSGDLEAMRPLARDLGLWDVFHEVELDVQAGFGPQDARLPAEDVEIVFDLCEVIAPGLELRQGPGTAHWPVLTRLQPGTELEPLGRTSDAGWLEVRVSETGLEGWVSAGPQDIECNFDPGTLAPGTIPPTFTPTPTNTRTPTPTGTRTPTPTSTRTPTPTGTRTPTPTGTRTPTPTSTRTPTPTTTRTPTPTWTPSPTLTPTCLVSVDPQFTSQWDRDQLGCPLESADIVWAAWEPFQGAYLLWRLDTNNVYVMYYGGGSDHWQGTWFETPPQWQWDGSYPNGIGLYPPYGLYEPIRGFGYVWRNYLEAEDGPLGWATDEEKGFCVQVQLFEQGIMFRSNTVEFCEEDFFNWARHPSWVPLYFSLYGNGSMYSTNTWQRH